MAGILQIDNPQLSEISDRLILVAAKTQWDNALHLGNINSSLEEIVRRLLNTVFDLKLINLNYTQGINYPGIDLFDEQSGLMIQVSANRKFREKIVSTLEKVSKHRCPGKHLWIFFVTADSVKLRNKDFECPPGVSFNPDEDIWDFQRVLSYLNAHIEDTALIQRVYACLSELISFDLGYVPNQNSYVAQVVNFIAHAAPQSEDRLRGQHKVNFDAKISFNHLESLASRIRDDSTCYPNISSALAELENEGLSPDRCVFNKINRVYHEEISESDGRQSSVKIFSILSARSPVL